MATPRTTTAHQSAPRADLPTIIIGLILTLLRRATLPFFVLSLGVPLVIILFGTANQEAVVVIFRIIFFPAMIIEGKTSVDISDAITAYIAWSLVLWVLAALIRWITKGRLEFKRGFLVANIVYIALYIIAVVSHALIEGAGSFNSLFYALLVPFFVGYAILWWQWLLTKTGQYLARSSSGEGQQKRPSSF